MIESTPPGERGQKRLKSGYPALTAAVVNLPEPAIAYANWFSYVTTGFVSKNRELYRSIRHNRALFPSLPFHVTLATLSFATEHPFPGIGDTCE